MLKRKVHNWNYILHHMIANKNSLTILLLKYLSGWCRVDQRPTCTVYVYWTCICYEFSMLVKYWLFCTRCPSLSTFVIYHKVLFHCLVNSFRTVALCKHGMSYFFKNKMYAWYEPMLQHSTLVKSAEFVSVCMSCKALVGLFK